MQVLKKEAEALEPTSFIRYLFVLNINLYESKYCSKCITVIAYRLEIEKDLCIGFSMAI